MNLLCKATALRRFDSEGMRRSKPITLAILLCCLAAGCETMTPQDRLVLEQRRVSGPLYQKMMREEPLALGEIVELSKKKVPPPVIIRYVDNSLGEYRLTTEDVIRLRRAGVSTQIIDFLLATPGAAPDPYMNYPSNWRDYPYPLVYVRSYRQ